MSSFGTRSWRSLSFAVIALSIIGVVAVRGQNGVRKDPLNNVTFRVEIDGLNVGVFRSVSGLSVETEIVEYKEGGSDVIHKLPGARKYPNIVLKRGFTGDQTLYNWYRSVKSQNPVKVNGSITIIDTHGTEVARYNIIEVWPSKWEISGLDGSHPDVIETIEIAHEGFEKG